MRQYKVDGIYLFRGKQNVFSGMFNVGDNGEVLGEIRDTASRCPRHEVKGQVRFLDSQVILEFLKSPTEDFVGVLSPIEYQMQKAQNGEDLSGNYEGAWRLPNPELCGKLGVSYDPKIGEVVVWIPQEEVRNKSQMTLTSKL